MISPTADNWKWPFLCQFYQSPEHVIHRMTSDLFTSLSRLLLVLQNWLRLPSQRLFGRQCFGNSAFFMTWREIFFSFAYEAMMHKNNLGRRLKATWNATNVALLRSQGCFRWLFAIERIRFAENRGKVVKTVSCRASFVDLLFSSLSRANNRSVIWLQFCRNSPFEIRRNFCRVVVRFRFAIAGYFYLSITNSNDRFFETEFDSRYLSEWSRGLEHR